MSQNDLLFLVVTLSLATSLVVMVVAFFRRGRRDGGDSDGRAGWWEGPWDDDRRR